MYMQHGDERQWLKQHRRSMEREAAGRHAAISAVGEDRRAAAQTMGHRNLGAALGDALRGVVGAARRLAARPATRLDPRLDLPASLP